MNFSKLKKELIDKSSCEIIEDVLLKQYTSFDIGGFAALFTTLSNKKNASMLIKTASRLNIPLLLIGGGTNLLVSDSGFNGLAVKTAFSGLKISDDKMMITAGSSHSAADLVQSAVDEGLKGLEFAAGLPGTVGGAVAGNAGCFGSSFGDQLISATIIDNKGELLKVKKELFQFAYRHSFAKERDFLIVDATFSVAKGDKKQLQDILQKHLELRRTKHPSKEIKTAGSYFKNLSPLNPGERRRASGALLEAAGAKNQSVGDAAVFEKHANIIVNRGSATAKDVLKLENILKQLVLKKFNIKLDPEVRFIGNRF